MRRQGLRRRGGGGGWEFGREKRGSTVGVWWSGFLLEVVVAELCGKNQTLNIRCLYIVLVKEVRVSWGTSLRKREGVSVGCVCREGEGREWGFGRWVGFVLAWASSNNHTS